VKLPGQDDVTGRDGRVKEKAEGERCDVGRGRRLWIMIPCTFVPFSLYVYTRVRIYMSISCCHHGKGLWHDWQEAYSKKVCICLGVC
jgi:hypothetical protein